MTLFVGHAVFFDGPDESLVRVCAECKEEIQRVGPDALDYCESCQSVEGKTIEITESEYERIHA